MSPMTSPIASASDKRTVRDNQPLEFMRRYRPPIESARPSGFRSRRKAIAGPAHGLYQPIIAVVVECLAQTPDMHVDRALLDVHIATPDPVEQLFTAIDPLGVRHEEFQQAILGRTERDGALADHDAMPGAIQSQLIDPDQLGFILAAAATQHRIHPCDQLTR